MCITEELPRSRSSLLCSLLGSLLMGLLYCFLTVTLRANQNVTGLTMTTFGVGIGNFFGGSLIKLTGSEVPSIALSATSGYFAKSLPFAKSLGWFGQIFLSYGFLAYLAIILALLSSYFLKHTRPGLHLRSVGESASTADAAGINVTRYKYLATCVGNIESYRIVIAVFKIQIYGLCGVDLQIARYYESVDDIILETLVVASFVWFVQGSACRS